MKKIIILIFIIVISLYNTVSFAKPSNEVMNAAEECLKSFADHVHPSDSGVNWDISNLRLGKGYESYQIKFDDIKSNKIKESSTIDSFVEFKGDYLFSVYSGDTEIGIMHLLYEDGKARILSMGPTNDCDKQIQDILDQSDLQLSSSDKLDYKLIYSESGFLALAVKSNGKDYILTDGGKKSIIGKKHATLLEMQDAFNKNNLNHLPTYSGNNNKNNITLYAIIFGFIILGAIAIIITYRRIKLKHIIG